MDKSHPILIGFVGPTIEQAEKIFSIGEGYECWDLKKFSYVEFIKAIKEKIPPINDNILRNYEVNVETLDPHCLSEKQFEQCSWALFIPDHIDDALLEGYAENSFLLNLYSPSFLYPFFYVGSMGITRINHEKRLSWTFTVYWHEQNQAHLFKKPEFITFFRSLLGQSGYGSWMLYRAQKWSAEDWRLFVASRFFSNLKDYDNGRDPFEWQRESSEMGATLESLFTAGDITRERIVGRLTSRIGVLLSTVFPKIKEDVTTLYLQRSEFVHGDFFNRIAEESKHSFNNMPSLDFGLLMRQREYIRWALILCLYISKMIKEGRETYREFSNAMSVLEACIGNDALREKLLNDLQPIIEIIPRQ